jgi:hypothetical protein
VEISGCCASLRGVCMVSRVPPSFLAWELGALAVTTAVVAAWFAGPAFGVFVTGLALAAAYAAWRSGSPQPSRSRSR